MSKNKTTNPIRFRLLGGSRQMLIQTGDDMRRVAQLDVAHWAMTGTQTDSMIGDPEFLAYMDADKSGRIRCDEVKTVLTWMLGLLKDLSGAETGSDVLKISAIDQKNPDGAALCNAIHIALENIGLADKEEISFSQINDHTKIVSAALQNGDGIIPPEPVEAIDPLAADCIRSVMALIGKHKDLSGAEGLNKDDLDSFEKQAARFLAWRAEYNADPEKFLPFGDQTKAIFDAFSAIREKTDAFFRSAATISFGESKLATAANTYDPLDPESVKNFLEKSPIANPALGQTLTAGENINPLWRSKVDAFFNVLGSGATSLTAAEWDALKNKLEPYGTWIAKKNTAIFDAFDQEKLKAYAEKNVYGVIRDLIASDVAVSEDLTRCQTVRKLIILQKYMRGFLNNFVSLHDLFDPLKKSMIQVGHLVMDGRIFSLCTLVPNLAEHKKIVMESDICVMYVDITRGVGADKKAMKLAVAVTSGHVRNLFVGKSGVFFTDDGLAWDAKVFDFVKQPASISEAMREPFYKFAEFLQKQADKFFATKSKAYETNVANAIQTNAAPKPSPAAQQTPAVSGSMMLMGGGIGIAAIGSAFAFMAKSLQGISAWTVVWVFLGIMLIFGGPIIAVSLVKLFSRNLSRFFEANGYALNMKMRLSLKMGRVFTFTPKLPLNIRLFAEQLHLLIPGGEEESRAKKAKFWTWLLVLLLLAAGVYFSYPYLAALFRKIVSVY